MRGERIRGMTTTAQDTLSRVDLELLYGLLNRAIAESNTWELGDSTWYVLMAAKSLVADRSIALIGDKS